MNSFLISLPFRNLSLRSWGVQMLTVLVRAQVLFGALWKPLAGRGSGENAELSFSHLSLAAVTTRHMGEAGKCASSCSKCLFQP